MTPGDRMELAFELVIRTLQGQGPKVQSVARPAPTYSFEDVAAELDGDCSMNLLSGYSQELTLGFHLRWQTTSF